MDITTISCPTTMEYPGINPETAPISCPTTMEYPVINPKTAPIWLDAAGNEYWVASGVIPDTAPTEWTTAAPDRVTVIVGVDAFTALGMMGLTAKPSAE